MKKLALVGIVALAGCMSPSLGLASVADENLVEAVCLTRGPDGQPLANDKVTIYPQGQTLFTDAEGQCRIRYPSPLDRRGLHAYVRHRDPDWIGSVWLPKLGGTEEIRLEEARSVHGMSWTPMLNQWPVPKLQPCP